LRKFFAPEVVQTSSLDCGPAALKCLLDGFGTTVSYGRLREACQTGLDGTSIDTMETVANELGLEAEQIMLPVDHLLLPEARALPAIVVVRLPSGITHFVVIWRRAGSLLQVMDPAIGRRWVSCRQFAGDIYIHNMAVGAADWAEFAASKEFQAALAARLRKVGISRNECPRVTDRVVEHGDWHELAALDAAARLLASLAKAGAMPRGSNGIKLLEKLCARPELIPQRCWSVTPAANDKDGKSQVRMAGAVLVRVKGRRPQFVFAKLPRELALIVESPSVNPVRDLARAFGKSGAAGAAILILTLLAAAAGTLIEAVLFRALLGVTGELRVAGQRMGAVLAVLLFGLALLLFEAPIFATGCRLGRQLENRLRVMFLGKIPKLADQYFRSRLISDMAERSHATHRLRHLPDGARQLLSAIFQLAATCVGIIWLDPKTALFVLAAMVAALLPALTAQPMLVERDLRARAHSAGLTRFYLDTMLGLLAIRAHGAGRIVRQEHEKLLGKWALAALRLQRTVVSLEALQLVLACGLIGALLLTRSHEGVAASQLLLMAYWALNLPILGQEIGALARQYPAYRNLTLRLLEPLGAAEEQRASAEPSRARLNQPPAIRFRNVSAAASGHQILSGIDLEIHAGSQVGIVGPSGAGKSSLVGMLLGWMQSNTGEILVDGDPLNCQDLRARIAWVDPAVQLWNRSLLANLTYGSHTGTQAVGEAMDAAMLRNVLEGLPEGFETKLGEAGALVSGGEGQRVRFARALLRRDAKLVILDEPFRGLDREKRRELLQRAREWWRGATFICITHDLAETETFDRVIVIEGGRIVEQGRPMELRAQSESRYAQLLAAEEQIRQELWSSSIWRRLIVRSGQIVEELPKPVKEGKSASQVA